MSCASEVEEQEQVCLYGLLIQVAHVEEDLSKFYFGAIFPVLFSSTEFTIVTEDTKVLVTILSGNSKID